VKGKKEDKAIEELFRHKLENTEIIPSESLSPTLMRRLGRNEFLHFIPSRFNIWYLGSIAITGAALAIILISGTGKDEKLQPDSSYDNINESEVTVNNNPANSQIPSAAIKEGNRQIPVSDQKNKLFEKNKDIPVTKDQITPGERLVSVPQNIPGKINEKVILSGGLEGKDKLQSGITQTVNLIESSVTEGCSPLKVKFKAVSDESKSYLWSFGDGGFSDEREPVWLFDIEGEYEVQLLVTGYDSIQSVSSTLITVHPQPVAKFEITPENAVIPDDEILFINYSSNAARYKWNFGDGNSSELFEPRHTYRKFGNYNVRMVASSEYGCTDTVVLYNAFAGSGYYINFPNAFMPNSNGPSGGYYSPLSDEAAHVFHPVFSGVSEYQLKIFTRLGILIFETDDINIGWDGYFKGQLSNQGVYIWKVRGNFVNGESFTRMGDVTLLKN